jgi:hypothetical protein
MIDFGSTSDTAAGAVLQPDRKIVVAGQKTGADDVAVARPAGLSQAPVLAASASRSRSSMRRILPVSVLGRSGTNSISRG